MTYRRTLALVTAAGAAVRLALLARQPLGYDEDFTAAVVARPFGRMLDAVAHDSAPPLFYLLEWPVAQFLPGAAGLRLVPALAGIALIPLIATLARRAAGDAAGIWTAIFVAALPAALLGAENARMYSLAGALVVAATLLLWQAVERKGRAARFYVGYILVAVAALWTDYFAALALAGVLAAVIVLRPSRRTLATAVISTAVAFASIVPWLLAAPAQFAHAGQGFWIPPLSASSVAGTAGQLFAGPPIDSGVPWPEVLLGLQVVAFAAGSAALVAAALAVAGRRLDGTPERAFEPPEPAFESGERITVDPAASVRPRAIAFLLVACSGVLVLAAVSLARPILEARYAGVMWLPLFALAGIGLAVLPRWTSAVLIAAMVVATLGLGGLTTHPETTSLIPEIESKLGPHDIVAADPNHYLVLLADGNEQLRGRLHVVAGADPAWYFGTAAYAPGAVVPSIPADVSANHGTIYVVADPGADPPAVPEGYQALSQQCVVRACLTVYIPHG
jgi:4-amino-4-deoxy-L-arabinose transferase-like glycosyltransferase